MRSLSDLQGASKELTVALPRLVDSSHGPGEVRPMVVQTTVSMGGGRAEGAWSGIHRQRNR